MLKVMRNERRNTRIPGRVKGPNINGSSLNYVNFFQRGALLKSGFGWHGWIRTSGLLGIGVLQGCTNVEKQAVREAKWRSFMDDNEAST
jgi:hypothetical protein